MEKSLVFSICLVFNLWNFGAAANSIMYRQPFDFQNVPPDAISALPFSNAKFTSNGFPTSQQKIMHTGRMVSQPLPNLDMYNAKNSNNNLDGFFQIVNEITDEDMDQNNNIRAAARPDTTNQHGYTANQHSYGYLPSTYSQMSSTFGKQSFMPDSTQPKFSLLESITSKSGNKISSLISLVLALLTGGSAQGNQPGSGIKDVIINGLIRPLLVAKGGIKMIISRLAIPVVSLILINVEVLITVWWLWDDCPASKPVEPQPEPSHSHNNNNSNNNNYNGSYPYN